MENLTFRSRLGHLLQKSRKALRLYSSLGKKRGDKASELNEAQIAEWRSVNSELHRALAAALDQPHHKHLVSEVFGLKERFFGEWKTSEADLHQKQRELMESSEAGDFIRAAVLSSELVTLKARSQAAQAAHHELGEVVDKSRVSQPAIELSETIDPRAMAKPQMAKVIPIRRGA